MSLFELIRHQIDLPDVAKRFTDLKRSGARWVGCCPLPNHKDSTPSFNVYSDDRWYCFGCREHGDVVDLWAQVRGLRPVIDAALDLAREYCIQLPARDPDAQKKAEERRQKEVDYTRQAAACHKALPSHPNVTEWWQQRGFDEELRQRFMLGTNRDGSVAVIPFWHRGRIHGLIRRLLQGEPKYILPEKQDLPLGYRPLFIPGSTQGDLHLVEGYIDALAFAALDLSVICPGGTGISKNQESEIKRFKDTIYILPDADDEGEKASREWVKKYYPRTRLCPAEYGKKADNTDCKDAADLFAVEGDKAKDIIEQLKSSRR